MHYNALLLERRPLDAEVERPVDGEVHDHLLGAVPRSAGALGVEPHVEDLVGRAGDESRERQICEVHLRFLFFFSSKNCSSRSSRSDQNCSMSDAHRTTSRRGFGSSSRVCSRP